ncbi:hypothetical protein EZV62_007547 [Acer yangbiense]|uniref:Bulb-type lectin domain-containing protein n=1 Tax=Acer yangbiense TaxID=1000413 RepID=A0A5C7IBY5_9ROSI|nr:hypothetical protein EZV62_007547 [Acer yangbiense]
MANKNTSIYKIFWFISCSLWASHVAAVDVLNQGDMLNSSASLVSRNELFTLRFFNLSSNGDYNTNYSYLGIFYRYNTNPGKPFWLANRDMPITDNSGALVIDETGKLMITFNGGKAPLELFSSRSNNKTGQNWSLTSWLTDSIPAHGAFSLDWDPDERQLILRRRGVTFWTSGVLSENNAFENIVLDAGRADHKFIEVSNEEGKYLTRVVLSPDWCDGNSTSSGCKRWEGPKCRSRGENFWKEWGYFPGSVDILIYDCLDICWNDCTCFGTAATSLNANVFQRATSEFLLFHSYINVGVRKWWIPVVISVAATIVIGIILVILFHFLRRQRRARFEDQSKRMLLDWNKYFNIIEEIALRDSCSEDRVLRYINVALLCVEDNPLDRPSMELRCYIHVNK